MSEKEKGYENPEEEKITTNNDLTVFGLWDRFCKKRRRTKWRNIYILIARFLKKIIVEKGRLYKLIYTYGKEDLT